MKNYLHFTEAEACCAFLILHGHHNATTYKGRVYVGAWNTSLTDVLDVALHPEDVAHFAAEFWLRWGKDTHAGNLAERLGCPRDNAEEIGYLVAQSLLDPSTANS